MIGELSPLHWLVVIGVFMLLFGAKRMPDAARSLGRSMRILKAELGADDSTPTATTAEPPAPLTYTAPTVVGPPAAVATPVPPASATA